MREKERKEGSREEWTERSGRKGAWLRSDRRERGRVFRVVLGKRRRGLGTESGLGAWFRDQSKRYGRGRGSEITGR